MKRDTMLAMTPQELDAYARRLGLDTSGERTVAEKADAIEGARGRKARIRALGMTVEVPVKAMSDRRVTRLLESGVETDSDMYQLMDALLGAEQVDAIVERATDDDGTIDNHAIGMAFQAILDSPELKNS